MTEGPTPQPIIPPMVVTTVRKTGRRRTRAIVAILAVLLGGTLLLATTASGSTGAAAADFLRSTIGPGPTAQVESVYLSISDSWQRLLFRTGVKHVQSPWAVAAVVPTQTVRVQNPGTHSKAPSLPLLVLPPSIKPLMQPALPGEGVWSSSVAPASRLDPIPLIAKAFIRPDPVRPFAIATILRFNLRHVRLHMVAGTTEPGGAVHMRGDGIIPQSDRAPGALLAVFNGGFKYADGAYGMMVNRKLYVNPIPNAATIGVNAQGHVLMGAWGTDPRFDLANKNLVSWRQNGSLLIDHGVVNPLAATDGAWGTTVLNGAYTWRSAIGMSGKHTLLYVAGNALTVSSLARALQAAGARTAMEMDINPFWVRAFFFGRDPSGQLTTAALRPDIQGNGLDYLVGFARDFIYVTRNTR